MLGQLRKPALSEYVNSRWTPERVLLTWPCLSRINASDPLEFGKVFPQLWGLEFKTFLYFKYLCLKMIDQCMQNLATTVSSSWIPTAWDFYYRHVSSRLATYPVLYLTVMQSLLHSMQRHQSTHNHVTAAFLCILAASLVPIPSLFPHCPSAGRGAKQCSVWYL